MASRGKGTTRSSSRVKTAHTQDNAATRSVATKQAVHKPLTTKDNDIDVVPQPKHQRVKALGSQTPIHFDQECEPIMAYLRIRPRLGDDAPTSHPYLESLSGTSVRMSDPNSVEERQRYRTSTVSPASIYTFSHVFGPTTSQSEFFTRTTLPLVKDLLNGQNALLFAYGVTNSGKTYTIQGGGRAKNDGSAGILPRALDVIFNSIEGLQGDGRYRPVRLHGVEPSIPAAPVQPTLSLPLPTDEPALAQVLADHLDSSSSDLDIDPTVLKLDRNYEYTIWLSYAEVYNEKIYDLLASIKEDGKSPEAVPSGIPRPVASTTPHPFLLTRKALAIRSSPPSDSPDPDAPISGKYIAGLRQFRVTSAEQAKALVKLGQLNRRVFGTLANSQSSRSHGLVTIRLVRGHRGERDNPTMLQVSRLTLVDLAGSERTKHTQTTGDRLREAGNINKSLMVLGQCMEVMRANQRKVAMSLAGFGRSDTRDIKKGLAVVPFRHSKLTEVLGDYFVSDGKAVMIVNVNPYDTGYDENSHVMKFAALAREVFTTPAAAPIHRAPSPTKSGRATPTAAQAWKSRGALKDPEIVPRPYVKRKVTIEVKDNRGRKASEACLEIVEEDEDVIMAGPEDGAGVDDSDGEGVNPLVDALFDEVEDLRLRLYESEMRCAEIEAETREEVMKEMKERMKTMQQLYTRRLMTEVEQNELKTDAKIDLLHRSRLAGMLTTGHVAMRRPEDVGEEEDVAMNLIDPDDDDNEDTEDDSESDDSSELEPAVEAMVVDALRQILGSPTEEDEEDEDDDDDDDDDENEDRGNRREIREVVPPGPPTLPLPKGFDGDDEADAEDDVTDSDEDEGEDDDDPYNEGDVDESDDDEEYVPPDPVRNVKSKPGAPASSKAKPVSSAAKTKPGRAKPATSGLSNLSRELADLSLATASTGDPISIASSHNSRPLQPKKRQPGKQSKVDEDVGTTRPETSGRVLRRSTRTR